MNLNLSNRQISKELEISEKMAQSMTERLYSKLLKWGYKHLTVNHSIGEYARDDDGDGFCEVHVNTIEGFWSLLRSWLRPHRGISQEKLSIYISFFEFLHNERKRGKIALDSTLRLLLS